MPKIYRCSSDQAKRMDISEDVILKLAGILTVKGGTNAIIEYFGRETKDHFPLPEKLLSVIWGRK